MDEQTNYAPDLSAQLEDIKARLEEAEETLRAIQSGEVDALVVSGPDGPQVYSLTGAETVYRVLVEAMNEGALLLTDDGAITYCNSAFADMLGVPLSQIVTSRIHLYVVDSDLGALHEVLLEGKCSEARREITLRKGSGSGVVPVQLSVACLPADHAQTISAVVTDLSEHKALEEELEKYRQHLEELVAERTEQLRTTAADLSATNDELAATNEELAATNEELAASNDDLRESEARFRTMADGTPLMIWVTDSAGAIQFVNSSYRDFFGTTFEALQSGGWEPLVHPDDSVTYVGGFYASLRDHSTYRARGRVQRHDGEWRWIESYGEPRLSPSGELVGMAGSSLDITERVEFERRKDEWYEREHRIAQMLQEALIPSTQYDFACCDIAVRYEPALDEAAVGGDFYDVFDLGNDRIGLLIGDVVGKGLLAAMRVAAARHSVRSYAFMDPSPSKVMELANEALCRDMSDSGDMLTAFFAVLDAKTRTLTYASAGHEAPLVLTESGEIVELRVFGPAFGILPGSSYAEGSRVLGIGDTVTVVTDGVTEARSDAGTFLEVEGVVRTIASLGPLASVGTIADGILDAAKRHGGGALSDDAAIIVFRLAESDGS